MECLWDFLPNFLQGSAKSLQRDGLVWSLFQPSVHFVPHVLDWRQIGGHRGPSHHQHILMFEKIHDETRNVWSSIVRMKGHVPSLTTDEGQHVRSNNLLQVAVCIQIAINNDQGVLPWAEMPSHAITLPPPNARLYGWPKWTKSGKGSTYKKFHVRKHTRIKSSVKESIRV